MAATAQVTSVFTARDQMTRTLRTIEGGVTRLDRSLGSLRGRIRTAFEFHVVGRGMMLFERGIHRLITAIPDLIGRGRQWAATVDAITDATGMSAEQASLLAGAQQRVGGSAASLTTAFAGMAKSVIGNREAWRELGVEVVRGNDGAVDAFATFQNLRQAVAATGGSLLSTAAAQKLLGRGGKELLDLLQLSDRQWRLLTEDVRRSGQVISETAAANAEALERSRNRMQATLDGLGSKLLDNLAPVLTRFVDGFATFIQNNMDQIVRLVVGGANTILTVVGSLLGMDLGSWSFSEQLGGLGNDARRAADGLRETAEGHRQAASAADRHSDAIARSRREQQRLRNEVGRAYRELFSIQQQASPVNASDLETELWRQRKIREVKDAQDRVAEAERALRQHRRTMDRMVDITSTASRRMQADLGDALVPKKKPGSGGTSGIFGDMDEILRESTLTGLRIAEALRTAIFGPEAKRSIVTGGLSFEVSMGRSGGLITHLQNVGKFLGDVGGHLDNLNGLLGGNGPLVLGLAALVKLIPGGEALLTATARASWGGLKGPGRESLRGIARGSGAMLMNPAVLALLASGGLNAGLDRALRPADPRSRAWSGVQRNDNILPDWLNPAGIMGRLSTSTSDGLNELFRVLFPSRAGTNPLLGRPGGIFGQVRPPNPRQQFADPWISNSVGFGINNPFEIALRRYLGASSPIDQGQQDQLAALGGIFGAANTTAEQTAPLGNGTLGVSNPNFPDIGKVKDWSAGSLGVEGRGGYVNVDNKPGTHINVGGTGIGSGVAGNIADTKKNTGTGAGRLVAGGKSAAGWLQVIEGTGSGGGGRNSVLAAEMPAGNLGGGSGGNGSRIATATRRTASNTDEMTTILRDIRRLLRDGARGGPSTSSLRAGTG